MANSLQRKVVLITGASSGLGSGAARLFVQEGCRVARTAHRSERLQSTAAEIQVADGNECPAIAMMIKNVRNRSGRVDILYDNLIRVPRLGRLDLV